MVLAGELEEIGATANCIIPSAQTHGGGSGPTRWPDDPAALERLRPESVSPLVVYLASERAAAIRRDVYRGWGALGRIREREMASFTPKDGNWTVDDIADWFDREMGNGYRAPATDPVARALQDLASAS